MLFTRRKIYFPLSPVVLDGKELSYNYIFKFLGLEIDFRLNFNAHIKEVRSKLSSVCGILHKSRNSLTKAVAKIIYMSIGYPYLNYCNILWSCSTNSQIDSLLVIQKKIMRKIMKKSRFEHSSPLFKRLKVLNIYDVNNLNLLSCI